MQMTKAPNHDYDVANALSIGGLAICMACLRPTMIGEIYSFYSSAGMVALIALYILMNGKALNIQQNNLGLLQLLFFAIATFQILFLSTLAGGSFADYAMKGLPMSVAALVAILIAISNPKNSLIFFDTFCVLILISCVCVFVCFVLLAFGVSWTRLVIGTTQQSHYGVVQILFPFTFSGNEAPSPFGVVRRLSGIFREPGILPPFACWAAAYAHLRRWPLPLSFMALAASVASLSTLGVPLAAWTAGTIILRELGLSTLKALLIMLMAAALLWPAVYGLEFVGLSSKIQSQSGSYEARRGAIETAFAAHNIVFGDGPSWNDASDATVNLIGRIRTVGLFGFVMALAPYFIIADKPIFLGGILPMIVTVLFAQPIAGEVPVSLIFLSWSALSPRDDLASDAPISRATDAPTALRRKYRVSGSVKCHDDLDARAQL